MIVPRHWAQAGRRVRVDGRDFTVRRFGFSDTSIEQARAHADERAEAAVRALQSGEKVVRFERDEPYGGASGLPIREEIVERHGDAIITRNVYGALCLNTPDVMFVDIDLGEPLLDAALTQSVPSNGPPLVGLLAIGVSAAFLLTGHASMPAAIVLLLVVARLFATASKKRSVTLPRTRAPSDTKQALLELVRAFSKAHPEFHLRVYDTPAGLRVLVMHRTFSPREAAVSECFEALGADELYARCCTSQNCFRARLTPKPWRIGITAQISGGVWPVPESAMPRRATWIEAYTRASEPYAACRFVEALGTTRVTPETVAVQRLHDELCNARSDEPLA